MVHLYEQTATENREIKEKLHKKRTICAEIKPAEFLTHAAAISRIQESNKQQKKQKKKLSIRKVNNTDESEKEKENVSPNSPAPVSPIL